MGNTSLKALLTAALLLAAGQPAYSDVDLTGQIAIATDYMFRGVSQTMSAPALQGELGFTHDSGVYGFVWGSNIDFTDDADPDDGARFEIDLGAGYTFELSDRLNIDVGATVYMFPETEPGFDYDYLEWHSALTVDDALTLTLGYSDNVFATDAAGLFYAFSAGRELNEKIDASVEIGHYDLERAFAMSYSYAELAIEGSLQSVNWRLSHFSTTNGAEDVFYASTVSDRFLLALSLSFE